MNNLGQRVKDIRLALNKTQEEFGAQIGIKKNSLSQIENGKNALTQQNVVAICKTFHVSENWLRTGEGQMFIEVTRADELQRLIEETMSDESGEIKRRIATAVLRLTPDQLRACTDWIKETFGLVEAPAADRELTIDEKVENYRRELEAEEEVRRLEASPTGNSAGTKEA
jgi:transcriptional regulator with XRE-family HTH domain